LAAVRVSLHRLKAKRQERFELLTELVEEFLATGVLGGKDEIEVFLDEIALHAAVDAYFLMSEAYKSERLAELHATKPPKIATISALVFADFKPIRAMDPKKPLQLPYSIHANALFGLYWASTVFDQDLSKPNWNKDSMARFFRVLRWVNLASIQSFKADIAKGGVRPFYDVLLDHDDGGKPTKLSDMPIIDNLLLVFEMIWEGGGTLTE
jgi:hypothetical protein